MASTATADESKVNPEETLGMTHTWAEHRADKAEALLNDEEPAQPEEDPEPAAGESQGDPEEPSTADNLQTQIAAQAERAQERIQRESDPLLQLAAQLQDDANYHVTSTQRLIAAVGVTDDATTDSESQQAVAPDDSNMARAVVVASVAVAATAGSLFVMFWTAGSTAGTASSAAASSKASSAGLKKVAPVFSPLFTRFEGREVLKHPNRAQLYTLIAANPGVRLQDLCTETELSRTAVTHHVRLLEQQHLITSERVGRSRHYYENGGRYERQKKDAYAVLQNDRSRDIARFIMGNPGAIQKQLCETLDLRASIAHWHIKRLQEASLVDCVRRGRTVSYYPAGNLSGLSL